MLFYVCLYGKYKTGITCYAKSRNEKKMKKKNRIILLVARQRRRTQ